MDTVLLVISNKKNRDLLKNLLVSQFEIIESFSACSLKKQIDLCLIDTVSLENQWEDIALLKSNSEPLHLPILLFTARKDIGMSTRHLWKFVDDIILLPIEKIELEARIQNLLLARHLSVELKRRDDEKLAESYARLSQAEKMAALGTMAAAIAHEINQPLNAIKVAAGSTLFWQKRGKIQDMTKITEALTKIEGQCSRIETIIANIRAYVRNGSGSAKGSCQIQTAIANALEILDNSIRTAGIIISVKLPESLPEVPVVQQRFEEIVINLIINSIHALEDTKDQIKQLVIEAEASDKLLIRFTDNGPGISEEIKHKVFQPFFSTKASGKGMGLGLAIVKSTIEACNGEIDFTNSSGGGVVFTISFPMPENARG